MATSLKIATTANASAASSRMLSFRQIQKMKISLSLVVSVVIPDYSRAWAWLSVQPMNTASVQKKSYRGTHQQGEPNSRRRSSFGVRLPRFNRNQRPSSSIILAHWRADLLPGSSGNFVAFHGRLHGTYSARPGKSNPKQKSPKTINDARAQLHPRFGLPISANPATIS